MTLSEIIFLLVVLTTMAGGAMAVLSGSIIYALIGLVIAMFGVAGLYVYLNSPFLAMMQILIYVGAISVLIAFAIMLAGPLYRRPKEWTTVGKLAAALGIAGFSLLMFIRFAAEAFPRVEVQPFAVETKNIGRLFFDELMLPFELISLLIVVGILGAIMLALFSREKK
jgi:NADH-quinone oxidoreductase subunit J